MSLLMGTVGVLGLASAIATGVLERTREFAVLRAVGASSAAIQRSVIAEGVFMALISAALAALVSVPLTAVVARIVGTASLGPALDVIVSGSALPIWTAIVVVGAGIASAFPAWRASRLTIREALAYQ
jgi:putative ABC transport system permease protein